MTATSQSGNDNELRRAFEVLGLPPGSSQFKVRLRYRQLVKEWHPDIHDKNPQSQLIATHRIQEVTEAYRTLKNAVRHKEVSIRSERARQSAPPIAEVDSIGDKFFRFIIGIFFGFFFNYAIMVDSIFLWIAVPLFLGVVSVLLGRGLVEEILHR